MPDKLKAVFVILACVWLDVVGFVLILMPYNWALNAGCTILFFSTLFMLACVFAISGESK